MLLRLCGWALIGGRVVAVAVDDLPFAVLAAIDVGDAEAAKLGRRAVDGNGSAFKADCLGQVSTDACGVEV